MIKTITKKMSSLITISMLNRAEDKYRMRKSTAKCNDAKKLNRSISLIGCIFISTLLISGCINQEVKHQPLSEHDTEMKKEKPGVSFLEEIKPINIEYGKFHSINGWINNQSIIYTAETEDGGNIYLYDLISGESTLLYKSEYPVVSLKISPSRTQILIHSSPSTYEGLITVIDLQGKEVFKQKLESYELAFEWNQFDENTILVASFTEDWEFNTYLINIQTKSLNKASLEEPFAFWVNRDHLLYLDWQEQQPSLLAPLIMADTKGNKEKPIKTEIFSVDTFADKLLTITVDEKDIEQAIYSFYSNNFKQLKTIKLPVLSSYSDWLIPYQDYNVEKDIFYTFKPLHAGEADSYDGDFQLYAYNFHTKEERVLFENMKNEPISCSPNGKWCLYGNYFEKLLNVAEQKVEVLVSDQ